MGLSNQDRRHEPRYSANLRCTVALPSDEGDILFPGAELECRTRDLSETGVGLAASSIYLGYTCIVDDDLSLLLKLDLGSDFVEMVAMVVHYLRIDEGEQSTYLIGLRILEISEDNLTKYTNFLRLLQVPNEA